MTLQLQDIDKSANSRSKKFEISDAVSITGTLELVSPLSVTAPIFTNSVNVKTGSVLEGQWIRVTGLTPGIFNGVLSNNNSLNIKLDGLYEILFNASCEQSDAVARNLVFGFGINKTAAMLPIADIDPIGGNYTGANETFGLSGKKNLNLVDGDSVSLYFAVVDQAGATTADVSIGVCDFSVTRLDGVYTSQEASFPQLEPIPSFNVDASDLPTIVKDGGNNVTQWGDKSLNGFNAIIVAGLVSPVYTATGPDGLPALDFTADQFSGLEVANIPAATLSGPQEMTIHIVQNTTATGNIQEPLGIRFPAAPDNERIAVQAPSPNGPQTNLLKFIYGLSGASEVSMQDEVPDLTSETKILTLVKRSNGTGEILENGNLVHTSVFMDGAIDLSDLSGVLSIGNNSAFGFFTQFDGFISEIKIYPIAMTPAQIATEVAGLATKWSIAI